MTNELAEKPMSYEEMIDTLKGLVFGTFDRTTSKEREALSRAIDLLSNSDEDCINREALMIALIDKGLDQIQADDLTEINQIVTDLPSVQPKPKTGHWISRWYGDKHFHVCSECQEEFSYDAETGIEITDYHICPNCGAKMESEDKE